MKSPSDLRADLKARVTYALPSKGTNMKRFVEIYSRAIDTSDQEHTYVTLGTTPGNKHVAYITVQEGKTMNQASAKCHIHAYQLRIDTNGKLSLAES